MTTGRHAVELRNRDGIRLVGIWQRPPRPVDTAIVLLSPGVKMRVAPHRLYVKMSDAFVARGYPVFRFDFTGLGDSDGAVGERLLADFYGSVALGRYVADTHDAIDWLKREHGIRRVVLGGLCGGAITAVLAAQSRSDVAGILGVGLPITVDGSNVDRTRFMSIGQLQDLRAGYVRRALDPKSWLRLLTLQTDVKALIRSLLVRRRSSPAPTPVPAPAAAPSATTTPTGPGPASAEGPDPAPAPTPVEDNTNPLFAPAMARLVAMSTPTMLFFSEVDRLYWEFEEKYLQRGQKPVGYDAFVETHVLAGANHVLTFDAWQREMLEHAAGWLTRRVPIAQPAGVGGA